MKEWTKWLRVLLGKFWIYIIIRYCHREGGPPSEEEITANSRVAPRFSGKIARVYKYIFRAVGRRICGLDCASLGRERKIYGTRAEASLFSSGASLHCDILIRCIWINGTHYIRCCKNARVSFVFRACCCCCCADLVKLIPALFAE